MGLREHDAGEHLLMGASTRRGEPAALTHPGWIGTSADGAQQSCRVGLIDNYCPGHGSERPWIGQA